MMVDDGSLTPTHKPKHFVAGVANVEGSEKESLRWCLFGKLLGHSDFFQGSFIGFGEPGKSPGTWRLSMHNHFMVVSWYFLVNQFVESSKILAWCDNQSFCF